MRRRNSESIGDVVMRFLRTNSLEAPLNQYRLVESWPKVAGPAAARYTEKVEIRNQTLYVHLRSAALRAELTMQRSDLVRRLNNEVRAQVITDIHFT